MEKLPIKEKVNNFLWHFDGRKLRLGVGCAWCGLADNYHDVLDKDLALLMRCYEEGFRYFDTSRSYHNSEQIVGEMVKRIDRNSIFLATKSRFPRGNNGFEIFKNNFYESFERLQTNHIDLFQIHDTDNFEICVNEVMPFLKERQVEGLIDYIGFATRSINSHQVALLSGDVQSSLSYINYSLLKKSAQPLIDMSKKMNTLFVNASVLHFGLIKAENPLEYKGNSSNFIRLKKHCVKMQELCKKLGVDIVAASLQYSLLNPNIDMTLNGIARISNIESTLKAMSTPIYPEQWAAIFALQEEMEGMYIQDDLF